MTSDYELSAPPKLPSSDEEGWREAPGVVLIKKTTPSAPSVHPPLLGQGGESFPAPGGLTPRRGRQKK